MTAPWRPDDDAPIDASRALPPARYGGSPLAVARELLGCLLVSEHAGGLTAGYIVETEAYGGPDDPASHAAFRRGGAVTAMWGPPGTAYVYVAYGVYPCFNVVTGEAGEPSAVLIRALEPAMGWELMARRRGTTSPRLAAGPGRLAIALGITSADNGRQLDRPPLWIQPGRRPVAVAVGTRVGIRRGVERPWRYAVAGHRAVSTRLPSRPHTDAGRRS